MKTTDCFVAAVMALALAGCFVMSTLPSMGPPAHMRADAAPPPGMREACVGQFDGARLPLPGRHEAPLTGLCERDAEGRLVLRPER
ncbi:MULTISPECIES: hypothetical protein [unclassified Variovorax]|uniref:hypothetical protein n=1 Tax=unclassified Variovorax TaxID=663243 RepID=UPI001BD37F23|nr:MULTISPECIES: hypothetical protein [unclassified Variovorax]